jgi:hypothetical protein
MQPTKDSTAFKEMQPNTDIPTDKPVISAVETFANQEHLHEVTPIAEHTAESPQYDDPSLARTMRSSMKETATPPFTHQMASSSGRSRSVSLASSFSPGSRPPVSSGSPTKSLLTESNNSLSSPRSILRKVSSYHSDPSDVPIDIPPTPIQLLPRKAWSSFDLHDHTLIKPGAGVFRSSSFAAPSTGVRALRQRGNSLAELTDHSGRRLSKY